MLVEWLMQLAASLWGGLLGTIPTVAVPSWIGDSTSAVVGVFTTASQLSYWVPLDLLMPVVVAVLACLLVGIGVKVGRILLSFLTAGGGSAG